MTVGIKTMSFMRDGKLVKKFCPRIKIGNQMCFIADPASPSGVVECLTKADASKIAKLELLKVSNC